MGNSQRKPRIGVIPGDPSGIGPELIAKLLADPAVTEKADILLIGDEHVIRQGQQQAGATFQFSATDLSSGVPSQAGIAWLPCDSISAGDVKTATETQASGKSVLQTLDIALDLAQRQVIDAIVFAPFNKAAMHMAGLGHDDELHYMAEKLRVQNYISELNTLDGIWTSRVTSHIPLKKVAETIDQPRIIEAVQLIDNTLKRSGVTRPRISVAALNPHAGDGGNFGSEEIDIIRPAVEQSCEMQINCDGPWPSDTVFLKARDKQIDAVVTMYHDQGQIALKLMGFDRGVTVQGGLPFPVATPAHGTAFNIAGQGVADVGATRAAFDIACDMVENWQ
jgi:4-hydroxythreonine-4-phosphate dehydrogenase